MKQSITLVVEHPSNHSYPFGVQFNLPSSLTLILFTRWNNLLFLVLNSFLLSNLAQVLLSYHFNCSLYTSWNLECNFLCLIILLSTHILLNLKSNTFSHILFLFWSWLFFRQDEDRVLPLHKVPMSFCSVVPK